MIKLGILAADKLFREEENLAPLRPWYEIHDFSDWRSYEPEQLLESCRSVEVITLGRGSPRLPAELAEDSGQLRYICHLFGTVRPYVSKQLIESGLIVTNWGEAVSGVAEGAMALLLCLLKQLPALDAFACGGSDERVPRVFPATLDGRDVGLYGFGPIGRHMARMLTPFGARIAIHDPYATEVPGTIRICSSLRELFATCQIISIHCGSNDQTRHSVTRELLELLPRGGVLVNTARGDIVDESALAGMVAQQRLVAGLDVIQNERDWSSSSLANLPGALLTNHKVSSANTYPPGQQPAPVLPDHAKYNLEAYAQHQPLQNVISAEQYDFKN